MSVEELGKFELELEGVKERVGDERTRTTRVPGDGKEIVLSGADPADQEI